MVLGLQGMAPLAGVRVLDLGMNIAGPQAASLLADLGADVIKVEAPGGDTSRTLEPRTGDGVSTMLAAINRNKRYVGLDLRSPDAVPAREALLRWSDVVVQNLRPGKAADLGVDAAACHALDAQIIHVSIEAFYPEESGRPGYDLLVQAETGMLHLTGAADGPPARLPGSLLDHVTGLWSAFGVMAALRGTRDGTALVITMSDVAQFLLSDRVAAYLLTDQAPTRMGSAIGVTTPLGAYPTADDDIVIGAASDALFRRLCLAIAPALAEDARFRGQADRLAHRSELDEALTTALARAGADAWLDTLVTAGVPVAKVRDLPSAVERHRSMSRTGLVPVEGLPGVELVANPLGTGGILHRPGGVGADSFQVLVGDLGLDPDLYARLVRDGVVAGPAGDAP